MAYYEMKGFTKIKDSKYIFAVKLNIDKRNEL